MNEQDKGNGAVSPTQDDLFSMGRRLVADGAGLSNLAGRAVFARFDELDKAHADRLNELLATKDHARRLAASNEQLDNALSSTRETASRRLDTMRRLRAQRDELRARVEGTTTPADLYGPQATADAGPFEGFRQTDGQIEQDGPALPGFLRDVLDGAFGKSARGNEGIGGRIGTEARRLVEEMFGRPLFSEPRPASDEDSITMDGPPRELLDLLFGKGAGVPDGVTVMPPIGVSIPRDAETDEDGVPYALREQLVSMGLVEPDDVIKLVGDGAVAILVKRGPCDDPKCGACAAVRALSERESAPQAAGKGEQGSRLTAAQVRDLAPGTDFRMVEMEGTTIGAHVRPMVRALFGPGMSVPSEGDRAERAAFERVMRELDKRSARFEIVG